MVGKNGGGQQRWPSLALVAMMALGITGCGTLGLSRSQPDSASMTNQRVDRSFRGDTLVSRLKPVQLSLPNGWQAAPTGSLHGNADLEAYNPDETMFLVVLGEDRSAVAQGNLQDQANIYLQILKGGLNPIVANQSLTGVDRVGSFPAVQYEVRGDVSQRPVAYLHTTVEMGDSFYQVVVWTPDDLRVANNEAMRAIVQEFRDAEQ